ncbi:MULTISPECIES: DUF3486 family protein [unclassified Pseudovibrio]|uniref:DUF3486 family protein n=1 Tax=unclassified Pseudovibrio TaxID=2627060 RepID=UPI0007090CA7|nr:MULTISPECIES: DUF3486 family protein [unclassified Pseudovibrio]KZL19038.1 hypothetical protein PsAD37_03729 [Pseudovibrio sp. Ad37]
MSKRKGRGRLSSLDLLPPEASNLVDWAAEQLSNRDKTQQEILEEFNGKLIAIDPTIQPISKSAFGRHAVKLATMQRRLKESQSIAKSLAGQMNASAVDDVTVMASQAIKTLVFEILTSAGEAGLSPKGAMDLASALRSSVQAQAISTRRRKEIETEFEKKTDEALEKTAQVAGLNSDQVAKLRREFLGLRK